MYFSFFTSLIFSWAAAAAAEVNEYDDSVAVFRFLLDMTGPIFDTVEINGTAHDDHDYFAYGTEVFGQSSEQELYTSTKDPNELYAAQEMSDRSDALLDRLDSLVNYDTFDVATFEKEAPKLDEELTEIETIVAHIQAPFTGKLSVQVEGCRTLFNAMSLCARALYGMKSAKAPLYEKAREIAAIQIKMVRTHDLHEQVVLEAEVRQQSRALWHIVQVNTGGIWDMDSKYAQSLEKALSQE